MTHCNNADVMISSFRTRPGRSSVGVVSSLGRSLWVHPPRPLWFSAKRRWGIEPRSWDSLPEHECHTRDISSWAARYLWILRVPFAWLSCDCRMQSLRPTACRGTSAASVRSASRDTTLSVRRLPPSHSISFSIITLRAATQRIRVSWLVFVLLRHFYYFFS